MPSASHPLQALGLQGVDELRVHQLHALEEAVEIGLIGRRHQRQLEVVEDLEQPSGHRHRTQLRQLRLLLHDPLAVVVELCLQPTQVIEVLLGLPLGGLQIAGHLGGLLLGGLGLRARGLGAGGGPGRCGRGAPVVGQVREPPAVRDTDPRLFLVPFPLVRHLAVTSIVRALASSRLGTSTVSTPLSNDASMRSGSATRGSRTDRANEPKLRSMRWY